MNTYFEGHLRAAAAEERQGAEEISQLRCVTSVWVFEGRSTGTKAEMREITKDPKRLGYEKITAEVRKDTTKDTTAINIYVSLGSCIMRLQLRFVCKANEDTGEFYLLLETTL